MTTFNRYGPILALLLMAGSIYVYLWDWGGGLAVLAGVVTTLFGFTYGWRRWNHLKEGDRK